MMIACVCIAAAAAVPPGKDPLVLKKMDTASEKLLLYEYGDALELIEQIEKEGISTLELEIMKAEALEGLGRFDEAEFLYQKALDMDPGNEGIIISLGNIEYDLEEWNEALEYYNRALEMNPGSVVVRNMAGRCLQELGRDSEALDHFRYAVSIDETSPESHLNMGVSLVALGRHREAVDSLLMAISLVPQSDVAYNNLSFAYYKLGKYRKAYDAMRHAVWLNPENEVLVKNFEHLKKEIGHLSDFEEIQREDRFGKHFEIPGRASGTAEAPPAADQQALGKTEKPAAATATTPGAPPTGANLPPPSITGTDTSVMPAVATATVSADATASADTTTIATSTIPVFSSAPADAQIATAYTPSATASHVTPVSPAVSAVQAAGEAQDDSLAPAATTRIVISKAVQLGESAAKEEQGGKQAVADEVGQREKTTIDEKPDTGRLIAIAPGIRIEQPGTEISISEQASLAEAAPAAATQPVESDSGLNAQPDTGTVRDSFAVRLSKRMEMEPVEGVLSPLPLPSESLEKEIVFWGQEELQIRDFSFLELAEMRKDVRGSFYFEDQDHWIWKYDPEKTYYQKLLRGSRPRLNEDFTRMLFIQWDLETVGLYIYEFATNMRGAIYETDNPLVNPSFSPGGRYAAVVEISSGVTRNLRVIDLETLEVQVTTNDLEFRGYDWMPDGETIALIPRECPEDQAAASLCIIKLDPEDGSMIYDSLIFRDADNDRPVSFHHFRSPGISFSPSGSKLLIYDSISGISSFYIADIKTGVVEEKRFTRPDGERMPMRGLAWGKNDRTMVFNYAGQLWIANDIEGPVFPLVASHFIVSPAIWVK